MATVVATLRGRATRGGPDGPGPIGARRRRGTPRRTSQRVKAALDLIVVAVLGLVIVGFGATTLVFAWSDREIPDIVNNVLMAALGFFAGWKVR